MQENPTKNLRKTLLEKSVKEVPKRSLEEQEEATERALSYFNQVKNVRRPLNTNVMLNLIHLSEFNVSTK